MSRHTLRQLGRLAWADRHSEGPYDDNFMWASWGTYRRLFWNLWWFSPSGPAGNAGVPDLSTVASKPVTGTPE